LRMKWDGVGGNRPAALLQEPTHLLLNCRAFSSAMGKAPTVHRRALNPINYIGVNMASSPVFVG